MIRSYTTEYFPDRREFKYSTKRGDIDYVAGAYGTCSAERLWCGTSATRDDEAKSY